MGNLSPLDAAVFAVLGIATLRGLFLGLIRESFSIAALGGAFLAVRYLRVPVAAWLEQFSQGQLGSMASNWIGGFLLVVVTIGVIVLCGKLFRRGSRWAGLGWADRLGGGALGAAEGAFVAGLLITAAIWVAGREHPAVAQAQSVSAFDQVRAMVEGQQRQTSRTPDVAAPGDWN